MKTSASFRASDVLSIRHAKQGYPHWDAACASFAPPCVFSGPDGGLRLHPWARHIESRQGRPEEPAAVSECGHGPGGAYHVCRQPPTGSDAVIRVAAIPPQTVRNRIGRSIRCADNRGYRAEDHNRRSLLRPNLRDHAITGASRAEKCLLQRQR
jgi:hypothetical protein